LHRDSKINGPKRSPALDTAVEIARDIVKKVEAALEHDPRVERHTHPLQVALEQDGALVLEGELPTIMAKKLALEQAAAVPGVSGIVDRIRVTPTRRMGDGEIRDHVRDTLLEEPSFDQCSIMTMDSGHWETWRQSTVTPGCSIDVTVDDGVVTLDGQLTSLSQKRLC
jgi:osmotically-inducible protein OsmY